MANAGVISLTASVLALAVSPVLLDLLKYSRMLPLDLAHVANTHVRTNVRLLGAMTLKEQPANTPHDDGDIDIRQDMQCSAHSQIQPRSEGLQCGGLSASNMLFAELFVEGGHLKTVHPV